MDCAPCGRTNPHCIGHVYVYMHTYYCMSKCYYITHTHTQESIQQNTHRISITQLTITIPINRHQTSTSTIAIKHHGYHDDPKSTRPHHQPSTNQITPQLASPLGACCCPLETGFGPQFQHHQFSRLPDHEKNKPRIVASIGTMILRSTSDQPSSQRYP